MRNSWVYYSTIWFTVKRKIEKNNRLCELFWKKQEKSLDKQENIM